MKIRRIDDNGDFDYGHSNSSYLIDNAQSVGLNIITRLREWYNDCFFAMDNGIDYPIRLGSFNQKDNLDNDILNIIVNTQDVIDVTDFTSTLDVKTREYKCIAKVLHIYSDEALAINFSTQGAI